MEHPLRQVKNSAPDSTWLLIENLDVSLKPLDAKSPHPGCDLALRFARGEQASAWFSRIYNFIDS